MPDTTNFSLHGIEPYTLVKGEEYMNEKQREHFKKLLLAWKRELMEEVDRTMSHLKDEAANFPDPADRASQEEEFSLELRTRDRERKLIKKIDKTLELIETLEKKGYRINALVSEGVIEKFLTIVNGAAARVAP